MRIMLVRAAQDHEPSRMPSRALGIFARVLDEAGHSVAVADYILSGYKRNKQISHFRESIITYRPQVIGFSGYSATINLTTVMAAHADDVRLGIKTVLGGPHPIIYKDSETLERLSWSSLFHKIVCNPLYSKEHILQTFTEFPSSKDSVIIKNDSLDNGEWIIPDFYEFEWKDRIRSYPLQTSRGCPYRCNFCGSHKIEGRKVVVRDVFKSINEVERAIIQYPKIKTINIIDDAPGCNTDLKTFMHLYSNDSENKANINIMNVRADIVDREFIDLAKKCRVPSICIGVESGSEQIFRSINKGESIATIMYAANLVKQSGIALGLCFVIGLPGDSLYHTCQSIRLAKLLKPRFIFWNMFHPYPNTKFHDDIIKMNGYISNRQYTMHSGRSIRPKEPVCYTPDFDYYSRKMAFFLATAMTNNYKFNPVEIYWLTRQAVEFKCYKTALRSLIKAPIIEIGYIWYKVKPMIIKLTKGVMECVTTHTLLISIKNLLRKQ